MNLCITIIFCGLTYFAVRLWWVYCKTRNDVTKAANDVFTRDQEGEEGDENNQNNL